MSNNITVQEAKQKLLKLLSNKMYVEPTYIETSGLSLSEKKDVYRFGLTIASETGMKRWSTALDKSIDAISGELKKYPKMLAEQLDKNELDAYINTLKEFTENTVIEGEDLFHYIHDALTNNMITMPQVNSLFAASGIKTTEEYNEFLVDVLYNLNDFINNLDYSKLELILDKLLDNAGFRVGFMKGKQKELNSLMYDFAENTQDDRDILIKLMPLFASRISTFESGLVNNYIFDRAFLGVTSNTEDSSYQKLLEAMLPYKDKMKITKQVSENLIRGFIDYVDDFNVRADDSIEKLWNTIMAYPIDKELFAKRVNQLTFDDTIVYQPIAIELILRDIPNVKIDLTYVDSPTVEFNSKINTLLLKYPDSLVNYEHLFEKLSNHSSLGM